MGPGDQVVVIPVVGMTMVIVTPNSEDNNLIGQWLNFKLFGITYLVGKTKFTGSIG